MHKRSMQLCIAICASVAAIALLDCKNQRHTQAGTTLAQILRYPIPMEPQSFDPAANGSADTGELLANIYDTVLNIDSHNCIIPWLADKWRISPDGLAYTFHLRPGVKFHKPFARPITADDVKYSIERSMWPETKAPYMGAEFADIQGGTDVLSGKLHDLAGFHVDDPQSFTIRLTRPRGYFLSNMTSATVVCREAIEKNGGRFDEKAAIGTGPFRFVEYRHGSRVVLEANSEYFNGNPNLARIERPIVTDRQTAHLMYEKGDIDLCFCSDPDLLRDMKDAKLNWECRPFADAYAVYIAFQQDRQPAFRDRRVRRAIMLAIDRDECCRVAYGGLRPKAETWIPPILPASNNSAPKIPYSPAIARELLAAAGFPGGRGFPPLKLTVVEKDPARAAEVQIIRDSLRKNLGVEVNIEERESGTFQADKTNKRIAFWHGGWGGTIEPHDFISLHFHSKGAYNIYGYSNPKVDRLCDAADAETNDEKRFALYRQAEQIVLDDAVIVPLNFEVLPMLVKPYVRNYETNCSNLMPHYHTRIEKR